MPRDYSEVSVYIRHPDTPELLSTITEMFAREGMLRVGKPAKHLHGAPALKNNRWAVHVLVGQDGWHLLRATPWSLWCDRAPGSDDGRFIQLARYLGSPGFLISVMDYYPDAYGEVLVEVDSKGQTVASGNWAQQPWPKDGAKLDTSWFYGRKLDSGRIVPRSPALQTLWQESRELWKNGENSEYDDCRGDSEREIFCRYLTRRLLKFSSWDAAHTNDWPANSRHTLYFEWPANDRPEPPEPEPLPEPDVSYPEGSRMELGDAVLLDQGVSSGRVADFFYSGRSVSAVAIDVGQPGKRAVSVDRVAHGLQLVERNTVDHERAAVHFLADRASVGDVPSIYAYGIRHISGAGVPNDGRIAYEWLTLAADKGHAEAQCLVGKMSKDPAKAVRYWRMSAEQGIELAQFELGLAYQTGTGVSQEVRTAMHWYGQAARQGNLAAQYNLGHLWVYSLEHTRDAYADAAWFKARAEQGDAPAQWMMGLCLEYGLGDASKDPEEAVRYYRMGAAQGYGPAICNLADKYEHGTGVQQDLAEALRLYLQSAEKHVTAAYYSLGNMYKDGRGVPQDTAQALYWLKKAADDGWGDAKAVLREMPGSGYGQAQRLLEQARSAVEKGEAMPAAEHLYRQAVAVYDPDDPEALALAFALHQYAAGQGHPHSTFQLGFMHLRGFATDPDPARAAALYKRAVELGDPYAKAALAELLAKGVRVP